MKNFFWILCLLLVSGCNYKGEQSTYDALPNEMEADMEPPQSFSPPQSESPTTEEEQQSESPEPREKKIIKDGDINLEVKNLPVAKVFIDSIINKFGAYYENEVYESNNYQSQYNLRIRVSHLDFEKLINATSEQVGKIVFKNIRARDVTEEFYDISTRLENNESYLLQYRKLLSRASSIQDILEIQEKIRGLEEEMDSKKGRLKYLSDQVDFSTLNLTLVEKHEWKGEPDKSFWEKLLASLKGGYEIFIEFILLIVRLWPFVILIGISWYLIKRRRIFKKPAKK